MMTAMKPESKWEAGKGAISFSTPERQDAKRLKLWSAMICHRFQGLAGLPAKQCRVQRHGETRKCLALPVGRQTTIGHARAFDGDKSPAKSADKSAHSKAAATLRLCAFAFLLLPTSVLAATNDLTSALQQGLFEEEANHNLEAAAQAYQAVSAQFDKDRKLAATAIFRLGEVYRKQGRTNEAVAHYERIVREFSDQQTLVTLSRQNLAGLDISKTTSVGVSSQSLTDLENKYT
jgi:tetratricopeptide (TPR) repeat protein